MAKHGTAPTQFVQVLTAVGTAVASIVDDFSIGDLINTLSRKGEKLTQYLRLVFSALIADQELTLADKSVNRPSLLESLGAVAVSAVKEFAAKDYFKVGSSNGVTIAWIGDNFKKFFLKKTERDIAAATLKAFKLKDASDPPIITALGSDHEMTLAHLWVLLSKQPNGESGILLTNGYANIFYIRDTEGILWAVYAFWGVDGWYVVACSVEYLGRWRAGNQVFGR